MMSVNLSSTVIFLDEWFLPVDYPSYTNVEQFYKAVITNNQGVIDELNKVAKKKIKIVYIPWQS